MLSAIVAAGIFGVLETVTVVDFSTIGLVVATVITGFDESATIGVPPETTMLVEDFSPTTAGKMIMKKAIHINHNENGNRYIRHNDSICGEVWENESLIF